MPVYMRLVMDQRRIPKLLVACANSSMPVEIIRIDLGANEGARLNFSDFTTVSPTGGRSTRTTFREPGQDKRAVRRSPSVRQSSKKEAVRDGAGIYDVTIELLGVIFIYNPPLQEKLGTGTGDEQAAAEPQEKTIPDDRPMKQYQAAQPANKRGPDEVTPIELQPKIVALRLGLVSTLIWQRT